MIVLQLGEFGCGVGRDEGGRERERERERGWERGERGVFDEVVDAASSASIELN